MSGKAYVVVPVNEGEDGKGSVDHDQIASAIENSLKEQTSNGTEASGSLRNMIASTDNSDSMYKYISWEDPVRTVGAYTGCMALLFGAHYIPLTQFVLKYAATALGAVSLIEFAGRSFTSNTLSARLRPEGGYKKIPEGTLNATLRDVHDLLQAVVVQVQKVIYGEDLRKTVTAFVAATGIFWLTKFVNPFWLTVLAVTSMFVAPLINSPQGRETARLAKQRGVEMANTAAQNGKQIARDGKDKASTLSSSAQESASHTAHNVNTSASSAYGKATETAGQLSSKAQNTTAQAGHGLNNQLYGTSITPENAARQASESAGSASGKIAQIFGSETGSTKTSMAHDGSPDSGCGFDTDSSASGYPTFNNGSSTTADDVGGGKTFRDVDDDGSKYVVTENEAGSQGIMNRARGDVALGETAAAAGL